MTEVAIVRPEGVEAWALRTGRLHPAVVELLDRCLRSLGIHAGGETTAVNGGARAAWSAARCRVAIDRFRLGEYSKRGSPVAVWTAADTIVCDPGFLNAPGWRYGNTLDLAEPIGMAQLLHEVIHVWQYDTRGGWWTIWNLWWPWAWGGSHASIAAEREAMDLEVRAAGWFAAHANELHAFKQLR